MSDIHSEADYPFNALSNFAAHKFSMQGVSCHSMEGFLQALKFCDPDVQKEICKLRGKDAKNAGLQADWKKQQILYWQAEEIKRQSARYQNLLTSAFNALFENTSFKKALQDTKGVPLTHSIGITDPQETVLTEAEFIGQLNRLRLKL